MRGGLRAKFPSVIGAALIGASVWTTPGVVTAQQAGPAPRQVRTEAPEPWRPAGVLHFLGLTPLDEGEFVDPDSILRSDGGVQLRLLTVSGQVRQVAEGDIRWTWERLDIDCAGRAFGTLDLDAYGADGTWLAGFSGPVLGTNPVDVPNEETLLAYACEGTRPAGFQIVADQARAVAGIIQAFEGR